MRYGLVFENSICYNMTIEKTNIVWMMTAGEFLFRQEWNTEGISGPILPSGTPISQVPRTAGGQNSEKTMILVTWHRRGNPDSPGGGNSQVFNRAQGIT